MKRAYKRRVRQTVATRGFSLVELLTVVAIIALLVGILVPAVSKVREQAKATATKVAIGTLGTGLESFRADSKLGGAYPPSASDYARGNNNNKVLQYRVMSPYSELDNGPSGEFVISGAGLLVWAMAGADLLGVPEFRPYRDGNEYWARDTDATFDNGAGAYALNQQTLEPARARVAPFVDLSKVEVTRWNPLAQTVEGTGSFELPQEVKAQEELGGTPGQRNYPMFLDNFGGPILYWRADKAGVQAVDLSPNNIRERGERGYYHFRDNGSLISNMTGLGSNQDAIVLQPRGTTEPHNLRWTMPPPPSQVGGGPLPDANLDGFWAYVRNKDIQTKVAPHNPDSFLLISAGPDGNFGTADDITNFDHNGAELSEAR